MDCLKKPSNEMKVCTLAGFGLLVVYCFDRDNSKRAYILDNHPRVFAVTQGLNIVLLLIFCYNGYYVAWEWILCLLAALGRWRSSS
jgi:hypothetical protein